MSRIGKKIILIPDKVNVQVSDTLLSVQGPMGQLQQEFIPLVTFTIGEKEIRVDRVNNTKKAKSLHGLYNRLLHNMILGVSTGFSKVLLISGVGFRAEVKDSELLLNLGYSNAITYRLPEDVEVQVEGQVKILLKSINKVRLGQVAAEIRSLRPVEPYKAKGICYENENIRRKEGKAGIK